MNDRHCGDDTGDDRVSSEYDPFLSTTNVRNRYVVGGGHLIDNLPVGHQLVACSSECLLRRYVYLWNLYQKENFKLTQ